MTDKVEVEFEASPSKDEDDELQLPDFNRDLLILRTL